MNVAQPVERENSAMRRAPISKKARFEIFKRDKFTCKYCGATPSDAPLQVDHIHPVADGGSSAPDNLVTACLPCNQGKGARKLGDALAPIGAVSQAEREQAEQIREWAAVQREVLKAKQEIKSEGVELWEEIVGERCPSSVAGAITGLLVEFGCERIAGALEVVARKRLYGKEAPYFFGIIRKWRGNTQTQAASTKSRGDIDAWLRQRVSEYFSAAVESASAATWENDDDRIAWLCERFHDACFWPHPSLAIGADWRRWIWHDEDEFGFTNGWGCGISIEWRYYENNEFEWWLSGDDGTGPRGTSIQAIANASQDVETVLVDAILAKTQPDQAGLIGRIDRVIQLSAYFRDLESLLWSKDEQQIAAGLEWLRCHLKMPPFWIPGGAN